MQTRMPDIAEEIKGIFDKLDIPFDDMVSFSIEGNIEKYGMSHALVRIGRRFHALIKTDWESIKDERRKKEISKGRDIIAKLYLEDEECK